MQYTSSKSHLASIVNIERIICFQSTKPNRQKAYSYGKIIQSPPIEAIPAQSSAVTVSNLRRQHRPLRSGGFFMSVYSATGGNKSGIAGNTTPPIAETIAAYSEEALTVPVSFSHTVKTYFGETVMTAITLGACATTLSGLKPAKAKTHSTISPVATKKLAFTKSRTGLIAYQKGTPVAWIAPGYHQGQIDKRPHTCTFVDVAYHRQTQHGTNLETADFASVEDAMTFIRQVFEGVAP